MAKEYDITMKNVMMWADNELEHVGRIVAVKDADLQYSYALSTVNGMAHLKDALDQLIKNEDVTSAAKRDLRIKVEQVVRVMNHLVKDFALDIAPIKAFNVKKVLGSLDYLNAAVVTAKNKGPTNNPAPAVEAAKTALAEGPTAAAAALTPGEERRKKVLEARSQPNNIPLNLPVVGNNGSINTMNNAKARLNNANASTSSEAYKNNAGLFSSPTRKNNVAKYVTTLGKENGGSAKVNAYIQSLNGLRQNNYKAAKAAVRAAAAAPAPAPAPNAANAAAAPANSTAAAPAPNATPATTGGRRKGKGSRKSKGRSSRKSKSKGSRKSRR